MREKEREKGGKERGPPQASAIANVARKPKEMLHPPPDQNRGFGFYVVFCFAFLGKVGNVVAVADFIVSFVFLLCLGEIGNGVVEFTENCKKKKRNKAMK